MENKFPKLRDDLVVSCQKQRGETVHIINDPRTDKFFRLREPEYFLANNLDGSTDPSEILINSKINLSWKYLWSNFKALFQHWKISIF